MSGGLFGHQDTNINFVVTFGKMKNGTPKYLTLDDALAKARRYCAFQERCHSEMRSKLIEWGVYGDMLEKVMADLISENFLNEERFACTFTRGKFRMKSWGRNRIVQELRARRVSDYCIRKGLQEIDEAEYLAELERLLLKKLEELSEQDAFQRRAKLTRFALQRGYEQELISGALAAIQAG